MTLTSRHHCRSIDDDCDSDACTPGPRRPKKNKRRGAVGVRCVEAEVTSDAASRDVYDDDVSSCEAGPCSARGGSPAAGAFATHGAPHRPSACSEQSAHLRSAGHHHPHTRPNPQRRHLRALRLSPPSDLHSLDDSDVSSESAAGSGLQSVVLACPSAGGSVTSEQLSGDSSADDCSPEEGPLQQSAGIVAGEVLYFAPVDRSWQVSRLHALGLGQHEDVLRSRDLGNKYISIMQPPRDMASIHGDGNCFFRTLSHLLTGHQKLYRPLRNRVTSYMRDNNAFFSQFSLTDDYYSRSGMEEDGTWATEMELIAAASMLATDICCFGPSGVDQQRRTVFKWLTYSARQELRPLFGLQQTARKMFICNRYHHYTPVYAV